MKKRILAGLAALGVSGMMVMGAAGCSTAKAQTPEEACDQIEIGLETLGEMPYAETDELVSEMDKISESVTNKEIKPLWDDLYKSSHEIYKFSDKLEEEDAENWDDEKFEEEYLNYEKLMNEFIDSYEVLAESCPALKVEETENQFDLSTDQGVETDVQFDDEFDGEVDEE